MVKLQNGKMAKWQNGKMAKTSPKIHDSESLFLNSQPI